MKKVFGLSIPVFAAVLGLVQLAVTAEASAQPPRHAPAYGYDRHHDRHNDRHRHYGKHDHDRRYLHRNQKHQPRVVYGYGRRPASTVIIIRSPGFGGFFDLTDRRHVHYALESAPIGQSVVWNNAVSGNRYSVVPTRTWQNADASYCREYTTVGVIGGREQQMYGTACRQPDGSWEPAQ